MLRYSYVLMAGLWAAGSASAGGWADGLFEELNKDFGSVPRGQILTHNFKIRNATKDPVTITSVRVSCGCVSATANTGYLAPGQETTLTAKMDTSRFAGVRTVTIFVQFGSPQPSEVRLWVQANSRSDFAIAPDQLAFGQVKRGSNPATSVTVTFYGNPGAKVTEARGESNYIQPTVTEVRRSESESAYQVNVRIRPDTPVGKWYTDVWLKTNVATMPQLRVPLTIEIESALSVSPDLTNLGTVPMKGEVEKRVIVRGVKPFKIVTFGGTDDELSVRENSNDARAVHVLLVKLKPRKAGEINRTIRLTTDLPEDNLIDFKVSAQVTPEAKAQAAP